MVVAVGRIGDKGVIDEIPGAHGVSDGEHDIGRAAAAAVTVLSDIGVIQPELPQPAAVEGQRQTLAAQFRHEPLLIGSGKSHAQRGHEVGRRVGPGQNGHGPGPVIDVEEWAGGIFPRVIGGEDAPTTQYLLHAGIGGIALQVIEQVGRVTRQSAAH